MSYFSIHENKFFVNSVKKKGFLRVNYCIFALDFFLYYSIMIINIRKFKILLWVSGGHHMKIPLLAIFLALIPLSCFCMTRQEQPLTDDELLTLCVTPLYQLSISLPDEQTLYNALTYFQSFIPFVQETCIAKTLEYKTQNISDLYKEIKNIVQRYQAVHQDSAIDVSNVMWRLLSTSPILNEREEALKSISAPGIVLTKKKDSVVKILCQRGIPKNFAENSGIADALIAKEKFTPYEIFTIAKEKTEDAESAEYITRALLSNCPLAIEQLEAFAYIPKSYEIRSFNIPRALTITRIAIPDAPFSPELLFPYKTQERHSDKQKPLTPVVNPMHITSVPMQPLYTLDTEDTENDSPRAIRSAQHSPYSNFVFVYIPKPIVPAQQPSTAEADQSYAHSINSCNDDHTETPSKRARNTN